VVNLRRVRVVLAAAFCEWSRAFGPAIVAFSRVFESSDGGAAAQQKSLHDEAFGSVALRH
jgi:hypothetical protein